MHGVLKWLHHSLFRKYDMLSHPAASWHNFLHWSTLGIFDRELCRYISPEPILHATLIPTSTHVRVVSVEMASDGWWCKRKEQHVNVSMWSQSCSPPITRIIQTDQLLLEGALLTGRLIVCSTGMIQCFYSSWCWCTVCWNDYTICCLESTRCSGIWLHHDTTSCIARRSRFLAASSEGMSRQHVRHMPHWHRAWAMCVLCLSKWWSVRLANMNMSLRSQSCSRPLLLGF